VPNPYAPRIIREAVEQASQLDQFLRRLRLLGGTDDELQAVADTWDDFDEGWTPAMRDALAGSDDGSLRAELAALRTEYADATTTDAEQADADYAALVAALAEAAAVVVGSPVREVLAWVGDDAVRAALVLDVELDPETGGRRKTLVEPLQRLLVGDG